MKNLVIECTHKKEDWAFGDDIIIIKITAESFKIFQKMILKWVDEDTNIFFNLDN